MLTTGTLVIVEHSSENYDYRWKEIFFIRNINRDPPIKKVTYQYFQFKDDKLNYKTIKTVNLISLLSYIRSNCGTIINPKAKASI